MYIEKDVEIMLEDHLSNVSKLVEIERKIKNIEDLKKLHNTSFKLTEKEAIESMELSSAISSNVTGKTNKITNTTERTALSYKSNLNYVNKIDKIRLELDLEKLEKEKSELEPKVEQVKNCLNSLNNIERFIIEQFYLYCDKDWFLVLELFQKHYKKKSLIQLKRYKREAIRKMLKVLN